MSGLFFKKNNFSRDDDPFVIQEGKIFDASISGVIKKRWVEDSWNAAKDDAAGAPLKEFLGISISPRRLVTAGLFVIFIVLVFFGRLLYLEVWQGDHYRALAEGNRLRSKPILAERGLIYDKNSTPLVSNIPNFSLYLIPQDLPTDPQKLEEALQRIASLNGLSLAELKQKISNSKTAAYQSIGLRDNLDYETAVLLTVASADLPGIQVEHGFNRFYLFNEGNNQSAVASAKRRIESLSHLLGYIGKVSKDDLELNPGYLSTDFIGKTGLEKYYEKVLRGKYGLRDIEVDALGKEKNIVKESPPQSGKSLVLSLDLDYQEKLEEILSRNLRAQGKKRGVAIVMDPRNGEILALVNLPTFNNNLFAQGISNHDYQKLLIDSDAPLFDRAWSGTYPTGSVIKPVIAAAALNEGVITHQTTFLSTGGLTVDKWFFPDWKAGGHGPTDVIKALAESVNTFFFIVGGGYENIMGLGLERLSSYFKKFGLGNSLGVDLPSEAAGFIPSREWKEDTKKERWYIGDTYNLSIGQGDLLATPLQVASYTAVIANGGTLYRPHLIQAMIDPVNGQKQKIAPQIIDKQLVPGNYLDIVKEGMRAAVTYGSARSLADLPVQVAAKTGTAQWSKKLPTHAWFTSFAPYRNPQIVVTVLIEEGGEGSVAAAPVAREFYAWWSSHRNP